MPTQVTTNQRLTTLVLLVLLLVLAQGWKLVQQLSVSAPTWDYLVEAAADSQLASRLQQLGASGWDMVSATRTDGRYELILKRPAAPFRLPINQSRLLP